MDMSREMTTKHDSTAWLKQVKEQSSFSPNHMSWSLAGEPYEPALGMNVPPASHGATVAAVFSGRQLGAAYSSLSREPSSGALPIQDTVSLS